MPASFIYVVKSSLIFLVSVVTSTLSLRSTLVWISLNKSSIWFSVGLTSILGSSKPVGRIICSTILSVCSISYGPGVADTYTSCFVFSSNSSNLSGRLSNALGNLNPWSTKTCFRALSPLYMPRTCGNVTCDSSIIINQSSPK